MTLGASHRKKGGWGWGFKGWNGKSKGGGDLETSCYTAEVSFSLGFSPFEEVGEGGEGGGKMEGWVDQGEGKCLRRGGLLEIVFQVLLSW